MLGAKCCCCMRADCMRAWARVVMYSFANRRNSSGVRPGLFSSRAPAKVRNEKWMAAGSGSATTLSSGPTLACGLGLLPLPRRCERPRAIACSLAAALFSSVEPMASAGCRGDRVN